MMQPRKFLKKISHQSFMLSLLIFLSGMTTLVQSQQSPSAADLGIAQYSRASYLQEATRRIELNKAPTWLAVGAYHTDDSIGEVVKYFKEEAKKSNVKNNSNPVLTSLLIDNWKIDKGTINSAPTVFGISDELRANNGDIKSQKSFGIFVLEDAIVRVHLISPHQAENSNKLVPGTMIVIIRERLPSKQEDTVSDQGDKIYSIREVTHRAHITFWPQPELTQEARNQGIGGTVILRAVFTASGKVENIKVVAGLAGGLTEEALKAARTIKFAPAVKDGRLVSQYIQIEYKFSQ
jgi:TonB family protein